MGVRGMCRAVVFAALALLPRAHAAPATPDAVPIVKAELVERFTRFVDWHELPEMVTLCVVGESPIAPYLRSIARNRGIKGKPARVLAVEAEQVTACHVVLIASGSLEQLRAIIARTDGRSILSIADETPGAGKAGAIINLYIADHHVRFEVNTGAAKRGKLTLRSKLLELARIVDEKEAPR